MMSLQRQHFSPQLFLKTLSDGPAGVWTHDLPHSSPVLYQLSLPGRQLTVLIKLKVSRLLTKADSIQLFGMRRLGTKMVQAREVL